MDPQELQKIIGEQPAQQPTQSAEQPAQPQVAIDPAKATSFLGAVMDGLQMGAGAPGQAGIPTLPQETVTGPDATDANKLDAVTAAGAPALTGGLKSVFETKDFLFGDTPHDRQSTFRQDVENLDASMKEDHPVIAGLASGIGQFTVAMFGLGKLGMVAKALPLVGEAAGFVEGLKGGKAVLESGKAALAGAIAFDPHENRLSNLIQDSPLANPINGWLAAKPDDTAAWGRVKNAMESLGMDAAIIGTLKAGGTVWKYLKAGDTAGATRAINRFDAERAAHAQEEAQANASIPAGQDPNVPAGSTEVSGPAVGDGPQAAPSTQDAGAGSVPDGGQPVSTEVPVNPPEASPAQAPQADPALAGKDAANADTTTVEQTANPTAAMDAAGVAKPKPYKDAVTITGADIAGSPARPGTQDIPKPGLLDDIPQTLEHAEKDWDNMDAHGDWEGVLSSGQRMSPDLGPFYDRFRTDTDVIDYMNVAIAHKADELSAQGFGGKLSDAKLKRQVNAYASLTGMDPAGLAGMLQSAGEASKSLIAKMIVSGSYAAKAFQDASLLAMRRAMGDYSEFGSMAAMEDEIAKRLSIATTFASTAKELRANYGRGLRALRGKPFDPSLFEGVAKDRLYDLLAQAKGDPKALKVLADPSLYSKIMDTANFMRVASLVSGPKTQLINLITNGYMVASRPLERIIGGAWQAVRHPVEEIKTGTGRAIIAENLRQYTYMGSALVDGFGSAVKAFTRNDGVLRPHGSDANAIGNTGGFTVPGTQAMGAKFFRPMDSIPNVIYNVLSIPLGAASVPTRILGTTDELVKQMVYRSKLAAKAHVEGIELAAQHGYSGDTAKKFLKAYVDQQLSNGFDAEGRGLDADALREANMATFQQDLLPGTWGKNTQTFLTNDTSKLTRFVLPFVKTPTNVARMGWKLTPGLNMLQQEYRQMMSGALGAEAKAQAVGQMGMGMLFMGSAAYTASQGILTGGGPSDPKLKSTLLATGWQPYSVVHKNEDGTVTYTPYNRFDPVGLPLGIIADIQDAIHILGEGGDEHPEVMKTIGALGVALAKNFTSRTYLLSLNQAIDALTDPDRNGQRFAGSMAQSFIPFSAATRQLSSDPFLRDARTVADKMMQAVPGMSASLPPKYNWLGQPVLNRQGLWSSDNGTLVDQETVRLGLEGGSAMSPPSPSMGKIDLRDITMANGENAYVAYQRLSGQPTSRITPLRDRVAKIMRSPAYERAPDGDVDTKGTKLWFIAQAVSKYRGAAAKRLRADPNVREALFAAQRKVIDHYKHLKEQPAPEQKAGIQAVIDGFGAGK